MKRIIILSICLISYNILSAQKYTENYIKDANKVGLQWWKDVNNNNHEASYNKLSLLLRNRFTLESWTKQISMLMDEFGKLESREKNDTYFQSNLEGFEDGFYVIIEYEVKYSKTRNHTESLLLRQNDQLEWEIFDFTYTFQSLEKDNNRPNLQN